MNYYKNSSRSSNNRQRRPTTRSSLHHDRHHLLFVLLLLSYLCQLPTNAETYTGNIGIGCTNGTCTISGTCDESNDELDSFLVLNATDVGDDGSLLYENIYGQIYLSPATCTAVCDDNCIAIPGSDSDQNECIGSAGYVYCPETQECIRPWLDNCPFDGTVWDGPINITVSMVERVFLGV